MKLEKKKKATEKQLRYNWKEKIQGFSGHILNRKAPRRKLGSFLRKNN